jgi:cell division transport system ATP-binding protein
MSVFKDFNRVGVTTLIASHDDELMAEYATRAFKIDPGRFADSAQKRVPTHKNVVLNQMPERNEPSLGGDRS